MKQYHLMTRSCALLELLYCVLGGLVNLRRSNLEPSSCLLAEHARCFCPRTRRPSTLLSRWHQCVDCQAQTKNGEQCVQSIRLRSALFHHAGSGEGVLPRRTIPKEESASCGTFSRSLRILDCDYPLPPSTCAQPFVHNSLRHVSVGSTSPLELYEADQETANAEYLAVAYMHAAVP
jgi:hypothetical protein